MSIIPRIDVFMTVANSIWMRPLLITPTQLAPSARITYNVEVPNYMELGVDKYSVNALMGRVSHATRSCR